MRVTGGSACGRRLHVPAKGVRPTQERVREALFSSLAGRVPDARVLDLFAGSGALGIEAWSRGAASVVCVEQPGGAWRILQQNIRSMQTTAIRPVRAEVFRYLKQNRTRFDLIFADPPYDQIELGRLLDAVKPGLAQTGLLVVELRSADAFEVPVDWQLHKNRKYGEARLLFLSPTADERP